VENQGSKLTKDVFGFEIEKTSLLVLTDKN